MMRWFVIALLLVFTVILSLCGCSLKTKDLKLNETVTMVYTVANHETDVNAKLTGSTLTGNNDYFTASYAISGDGSIAADGTATVTITVEMVKTPVTGDGKATFAFTVDADPVQ